ncbi:MAG: hypothetical protein Q7R76_03615 [Candidatus Woesearchaeota archaeon]|nr:hypothetical protein [Candidatus Woesearchaeota archaeon]
MEQSEKEASWYGTLVQFSRQYHHHRRLRYAVHFILFLTAMSVFFMFKKSLFFLVIFLAANMIAGMVLRGPLRLLLFGVEMVMMPTVLSGIAFGSGAGVLTGVATAVVMLFFQGASPLFALVFIPLYGLSGFVAGQFPSANLMALGIGLSVIYSAISSFFIFMMGGKVWKCGWFIATNLVCNAFLFVSVAPWLLKAMT